MAIILADVRRHSAAVDEEHLLDGGVDVVGGPDFAEAQPSFVGAGGLRRINAGS
jgi:hypothetical protein